MNQQLAKYLEPGYTPETIARLEALIPGVSIICEEFQRPLDEEDLIQVLCDEDGFTRAEWDTLPRHVRTDLQLAWCEAGM